MSVDELKRGRSKIRNRAIASVFRTIRLMERFGTAWEKIEADLVLGYPEPTLDGSNPVFQATLLPHPNFATSPSTSPHRQNGEVSGEVATIPGRGEVRRRRQRELEVIGAAEDLKRDELIERAEVAARTLDRDLEALTSASLIRFEGSPKTGGYRLTDEGRAALSGSQPTEA